MNRLVLGLPQPSQPKRIKMSSLSPRSSSIRLPPPQTTAQIIEIDDEEEDAIPRAAPNSPISPGPLLLQRRRQQKQGLTPKQQLVIDKVLSGENVLITGEAGTGKTHLLRYLLDEILGNDSGTYVCAMTGIAAVPIGGTTLHSFAGIGVDAPDPAQFVAPLLKVKNHPRARKWLRCKRLVIDEISMLSGDLFTRLDQIARRLRRNPSQPFGGIQLVLCGDFMQLPPIGVGASYCFQSPEWEAAIGSRNTVVLDTIFRQRDPAFTRILNEVRMANLSPESVAILKACGEKIANTARGIVPTRLYCTRKDCDAENSSKLGAIPERARIFDAQDDGSLATEQLNKCMMAPQVLHLKHGAQVMLISNLSVEEGLVNGSRGVVHSFSDAGNPIVRFTDTDEQKRENDEVEIMPYTFQVKSGGSEIASRTQIPLVLAWALTIHKSQGMSLNRVDIDFTGMFAEGQAYVALSRARALKGMRIIGFDARLIKANSIARKFYERNK